MALSFHSPALFRRLCWLLVLVVVHLAAQPSGSGHAPTWPPAGADLSIADQWLAKLTLRQRIAQLLVVPFYGDPVFVGSDADRAFQALVRDAGVGGLIILNRSVAGSVVRAEPYQMAAFLNRMQRLAGIPLLVAGDFERGASMRLNDVTVFPHAMSFGAANDLEMTRRFGEATACEAKALGVHWILAPSADLNSNAENPVIHQRSFGEVATLVSAHTNAFVKGVQQNKSCPLPATVKHFPGHGDTHVDSHMGMPVIERDRDALEASDLVPFRSAITSGVYSVMPGHLRVPAFEPQAIPATVSKAVVTGLLRDQLGFQGLVVSDGMDMKGITGRHGAGEAAVRAVEAGVDVLVIPPDPMAAINALEAAVKAGRLAEERINQSALRILQAKAALGLHANKLVDVEAIATVVPSPEYRDLATQVTRKGLTLARNQRNTLPLRAGAGNCAIAMNRSRTTTDGRTFLRAVAAKDRRAKVWYVDDSMSDAAYAQMQKEILGCTSVAIASFLPVASAAAKEIPLSPRQASLIKALESSSVRTILVPFANPYLMMHFPNVSAVVLPFSSVTTAETVVADALFGAFSFMGKSPIRIPGALEAGAGLTQ